MITNFTEYFSKERDIFVQNISNGCQVSVIFDNAGQAACHLFPNTRDPVNLTRYVPFAAVKSSVDFRKMLNRTPPALRLLTEDEYIEYFTNQAEASGVSVAEAMKAAEAKRRIVDDKLPLANAPEPVKLHNVEVVDGKKVAKPLDFVTEEEVINPRVMNLCLQVHPSLSDQEKMTAQAFLAELDTLHGLTMDDWDYIQSHGYYKSVQQLAKKKISDLAAMQSKLDQSKPKKTVSKPKVAKPPKELPPE